MPIERTTHMAFGIGLFEQMSDALLIECFKGATAEQAGQIREQLAKWRAQGFEFVPCACGNYDPNGACNGGIRETIDRNEHH